MCEGDGLDYHVGQKFSTPDQDNDIWGYGCSCALKYSAGWWYGNCSESNLNGLYMHGKFDSPAAGVEWEPWKGFDYSLKFTEMKVKPHGK